MRKTFKKLLSFLLVFCMCAAAVTELSVGNMEAQAAEGAWNLAQGQPVTASSSADGTTPGNAVDGNAGTSWNSNNLKNFNVSDTSKDQEAQTPQWIQIDLGHTGSVISQIAIKYKNNMVWSMAYRIQTSDDPDNSSSWEDAAVVSRPSANGTLVNGEGQNIANASDYTDTLTTSSLPALTKTDFKRFVRIYFEKTNAQAGGHNVNIAEIEIMGTNPSRNPSETPNGYLNGISGENLQIVNGQVVLPEAQGLEVSVRGSELERVVSNSGAIIGWNIGSRDVTLLLQAKEMGKETNWAEKNVTISVPDHKDAYPADWFPEITYANPRPEVIPSIQEWYGYEGDFQLTADSKIILQDAANVGLVKAAENMKSDVEEISDISLEVVNGGQPGPNDICIESLAADTYGVGSEGYVMVTNEKGLHIYAPTYTGCLYGTITAEQILWQAADHLSIPKGIMRDYPSYEIRGVKLDVARTPYRYQQLKDYAKIMLWYKMNEYGLHISDNDNANINGATRDTHSGFHRLESSTFPSLKSETKHAGIPQDLVNAEYYNNNEDYQGNPTYTKEEWRKLTEQSKDYGMHLLTEIDLPGHSLLYNKYADENPDQIDWLEGGIMISPSSTGNSGYLELLDLTGENKKRALRFGKELWEEYTDPKNPTIYGDIVHIGSDEYWVHDAKDGFAEFADEMRKVIQENLGPNTKIRMWGAGSGMFSTAKTVLNMTDEELAANYQLDIWHPSYDDANKRVHEGYGVVNCRDAFMYGNPGRRGRDVPNAEYLFNDWNPTMFGGGNTMIGEPNLLGAKAVLWGDQSQEGMTEKDIHQRVMRAVAILSEKTWGGTAEDDTFSEYELRAGRLAEGPGTTIAMEIESETSLVLDYNFENISGDGATVYDTSGNGYNASLTGGDVAEGWLSFDGNTLLSTPLKTLSYPYTVSFDVKAGTENTEESSLFSGYDGRIQAAGHDGHMSADVNYFTRDFEYTLPTDNSKKHITIVGTFQATRLYVDGELVSFLSQKHDDDGVAEGSISTLYSSVLLPLEKIGQDFHGEMANLKVYNKAMSASEILNIYNGEKPELVNVAQNTNAGSKCYTAGNNPSSGDNGEQRTSIAMKAIDGEAFTSEADASSEIYSYWMGGMGDSALTVDLGQERTISRIDIQWRTGGIGNSFKIQTSNDGKNWNDAKSVSGNSDSRQQILLDTPVKTRFLRMQGTQSSGSYKIQEFLAYEWADKSALEGKLQEMEQMAEEKESSFESTGAARELFQSILLGKAVLDNPLAVKADAERAVTRYEEAIKELEDIQKTKGELESVLTSLKSVIEAGRGEYSIESWQAFVNAYEEASNAFAEADTARLKALVEKLEKLEQTKSELEKVSPITPDPIPDKIVKPGDIVKDKNGNFEYRILDTDKKTASVIKGLKPESKKVEIPASEEFSGVNYQIVKVEAKALKGYKKMTSLTIGANVEEIGNQAFAGNKKLKSVKVTGTKIKKVLKKAFKGTGKKMTVQFPKKLKKSKKMALMKKFTSAGMTKKAKMK